MKNVQAYQFSSIKDYINGLGSVVVNYAGSTSEEVTTLYINSGGRDFKKLPSDELISTHQYFAAFDAWGKKLKEWKIISVPFYINIPGEFNKYEEVGTLHTSLDKF